MKKSMRLLALLLMLGFSAGSWTRAAAGETWAVYLYLCGSDLETKYGSATDDIREALKVKLPESVDLIILTGGAREWKNKGVDAEAVYMLRQVGDDMEVIEKINLVNMGHPQTLFAFMEYCGRNFPADRKMLILWDHGGGSAGGICYDELFDGDPLGFAEIKDALVTLYGEAPDEKPFDIIGFDACLMATVDMAAMLAPFADYMVASEQLEPACGWRYDAFLGALAKNPAMDGAELGRVICDTYYEACRELGLEGDVTLSTIDLSKIGHLSDLLAFMSVEGIGTMMDNPSGFYAELGRGASKADAYSGGMVDLVSFAMANSKLFPESAELTREMVAECVVHQVTGPYRKNSHGIAAFLPSPGNDAAYGGNYGVTAAVSGTRSFYHLFEPLMTGDFSDETVAFLEELVEYLEGLASADDEDEKDGPSVPELRLVSPGSLAGAMDFADASDMDLDDHPIEFITKDDQTYVRLTIGPEKAEPLKSVTFMLALTNDDFSEMFLLGEDSDADLDWEKGVFTDDFRGVWGSIDGYYVMMHITSMTDEYILYEVPLVIDDKQYNLTVAYDFDSEEYRMLAARLDESETGGVPSREERLLKEGDVITTLYYKMDAKTEEMVPFRNETFTLGKTPRFSELALPDGTYAMVFLMTDYKDKHYFSDIAGVSIKDGDVKIFNLDERLEEMAELSDDEALNAFRDIIDLAYAGEGSDGTKLYVADSKDKSSMAMLMVSPDGTESLAFFGEAAIEGNIIHFKDSDSDKAIDITVVSADGEEMILEFFEERFTLEPITGEEFLEAMSAIDKETTLMN